MAEAEYISKEAALACFSDWIDRYGHEHTADEMVEYQKIENLPAADVRPVVLCKDCHHRDPEDRKCDSGEMERQGCVFPVDDDYFCAYGER